MNVFKLLLRQETKRRLWRLMPGEKIKQICTECNRMYFLAVLDVTKSTNISQGKNVSGMKQIQPEKSFLISLSSPLLYIQSNRAE